MTGVFIKAVVSLAGTWSIRQVGIVVLTAPDAPAELEVVIMEVEVQYPSRRQLLQFASSVAGGIVTSSLLPPWAKAGTYGATDRLAEVSGNEIELTLDRAGWPVDGKAGPAITVNGTVPGPILRLREGQRVRISVINRMDETASIHWHGMLVPFAMDGVPGVTFPGIPARSTFVYEFTVRQNGTYWYHSHSGFQEQLGLYGPIVIDPKGADPVHYDREHVVMLSDFSFMSPHEIIQRMKQQSGAFNYQRQTIAGLLAGRDQTLEERLQWAKMRMDPTDISDVTGAVLKFLINGHRSRGQLDWPFQAGRAPEAALHQRSGPDGLQRADSRLAHDRGGGRRSDGATDSGRRVPDRQRRNLRCHRPADGR